MPLILKSAAWSYEQEYRVIAQERAVATPHETVIADYGKVSFPSSALTGIIVGCMASPETLEKVEALILEFSHDAKLKKAVRSLRKFEIVIE